MVMVIILNNDINVICNVMVMIMMIMNIILKW